MDDTSRSKVLFKFGILWVIRIFRFFLGVQVVEVAEELVKAVIGGKKSSLSPKWFFPNCPVA